MSFIIKLADIPIRVNAMFDSTERFCGMFLSDEMPSAEVTITEADIENEKKFCEQTDINEGNNVGEYSEEYLELLALFRLLLENLFAHHVILFHSSVIAYNGKAYVFTAKSGTGKTTHSLLWVKNIPGCHILNGDKPLLKFCEDGIYVCGTPWQGKENYGRNEILPLEAVCVLERDSTNHIERVSAGSVFASLMSQSFYPKNANKLDYVKLLARFDSVKTYRLGCNMDNEAALVAYAGMVENQK